MLRVPFAPDRSWWLIAVPLAAMLVAGVMKAIDIGSFAAQLTTWPLIPRGWEPGVAMAVVNLELLVTVPWFLGLSRTASPVGAVVLLVLFSIAYAAHHLLGHRVSCGCFGQLRMLEALDHQAPLVLARNALLTLMLMTGLILGHQNRGRPGLNTPARCGIAPTRPNAFTLIESLMLLAIITILIALTLPSIGRSRDGAYETASLSNLRQHAMVFDLYTSDYQSIYPCFLAPDTDHEWVMLSGIGLEARGYFSQDALWALALADQYYEGEKYSRSFHPPLVVARDDGWERSWFTEYWYSSAFLADPSFWQYETRTGPEQWRPTRSDEVNFPSQKAILWQSLLDSRDWREIRNLFGFVDGSARAVRAQDVLPQYTFGTVTNGSSQGGSTRGLPGMYTINGVRGRDVK
jgi:type II secretory pathway pseudopilin PulG